MNDDRISGPQRLRHRVRRLWCITQLRTTRWLRTTADAGMTTAEYAVGTIAAVAFAVGLYKVVSSGTVQNALRDMIVSALHSV